MKIERLTLGFFAVNCYIVSIGDNNIIIDPGADIEKIQKYLQSYNINPDFILNTHGHYDHIGAVPEIMEKFNVPFYIDRDEEQIVIDPEKNCSSFFSENTLLLKTYNLINSSGLKYFDKLGIKIVKTPGHTPGSIIIRIEDNLFTGDLLFKGAIGRTDLPGGSLSDIKNSLLKLRAMDKKLNIYPGHGLQSNLGYEIRTNYYLEDDFLGKGD